MFSGNDFVLLVIILSMPLQVTSPFFPWICYATFRYRALFHRAPRVPQASKTAKLLTKPHQQCFHLTTRVHFVPAPHVNAPPPHGKGAERLWNPIQPTRNRPSEDGPVDPTVPGSCKERAYFTIFTPPPCQVVVLDFLKNFLFHVFPRPHPLPTAPGGRGGSRTCGIVGLRPVNTERAEVRGHGGGEVL